MSDVVQKAFGPDAIRHHFCEGVYAKEARIPAGGLIVSHAHPFDHMSILASGWVRLEVDGELTEIHGPSVVHIAKGKHHKVLAIAESVWFCIHPTEETDPSKVDDVILQREPG